MGLVIRRDNSDVRYMGGQPDLRSRWLGNRHRRSILSRPHLGCRQRPAAHHPQRPHRRRVGHGIQPGRLHRRNGGSGRDGAAVGHRVRRTTHCPTRAHRRRPCRAVQPGRDEAGLDRQRRRGSSVGAGPGRPAADRAGQRHTGPHHRRVPASTCTSTPAPDRCLRPSGYRAATAATGPRLRLYRLGQPSR